MNAAGNMARSGCKSPLRLTADQIDRGSTIFFVQKQGQVAGVKPHRANDFAGVNLSIRSGPLPSKVEEACVKIVSPSPPGKIKPSSDVEKPAF
jgi:hypothetical protein